MTAVEILIAGDLFTVAGRRKTARVADVYWLDGGQVVITTVDGRAIYTPIDMVRRVVEAPRSTQVPRRAVCWPSWRRKPAGERNGL